MMSKVISKQELTLFARVASVLLALKGHQAADFDAISAGRARFVCLQTVA